MSQACKQNGIRVQRLQTEINTRIQVKPTPGPEPKMASETVHFLPFPPLPHASCLFQSALSAPLCINNCTVLPETPHPPADLYPSS